MVYNYRDTASEKNPLWFITTEMHMQKGSLVGIQKIGNYILYVEEVIHWQRKSSERRLPVLQRTSSATDIS